MCLFSLCYAAMCLFLSITGGGFEWFGIGIFGLFLKGIGIFGPKLKGIGIFGNWKVLVYL